MDEEVKTRTEEGETREVFGPPPPGSVEHLPEDDGEEEAAEGKKEKKKGAVSAPAKKKRRKKKRAADEKGEKEEKGGSTTRRKVVIVVLLLAAVMLLSCVMTSILLKLLAAAPPAEETPAPSPTESAEPSLTPEPTPTPTPAPTPEPAGVTQNEAREYFESLTPAELGLEGESMEDYEIYPAEKVVLVSGIPCVEVFVYSNENRTGTNDIQGTYLLSRGSPRRLFLLDEETGKARELNLENYSIATPAPESSPTEAVSAQPQESGAAEGKE